MKVLIVALFARLKMIKLSFNIYLMDSCWVSIEYCDLYKRFLLICNFCGSDWETVSGRADKISEY